VATDRGIVAQAGTSGCGDPAPRTLVSAPSITISSRMLMTPITTERDASPMAASSSTEPSEIQYQAILHSLPGRQLPRDRGMCPRRAALTAGGVLSGRPATSEHFLVAAVPRSQRWL